MPEIRQLPPSVVNKIAAGEVIERPASVIKELLENAVDAGARRIDVQVEHGGEQLLRVSDDGCGIQADQLPLAIASHATSKIRDADDLFHVGTLGFRGEALASIAEISHLKIISRTREVDSGALLEVNGGVLGQVTPFGCPPGTTIEVRQLFFNTPVRRKFLRTSQTEMGHISEAFVRVALPHPQIHFTLRSGERVVHDLPPVETWRERILTCFGAEVGESLIWIEGRDDAIHLSGYVAEPNCSRANNRLQYLFLNGRHIRDRSLQHALGEAYRGLLMTGRFPIAFLRIQLPPEIVDVNVHPTKMEVRFQDASRVYAQLLSTLRNKFLASDFTARVRPIDTSAAASSMSTIPASAASVAGAPDRQLFNWQAAAHQTPRDPFFSQAPAATIPVQQVDLRSEAAMPETPIRQIVPSRVDAAVAAAIGAPISNRHRGMQVHNRYVVAESDEGLLVIDQHALHERILYERLREKVLSKELEVQRLLVPDVVTLTAAEAAAAIEHSDTLSRLGLEIEPFGGDAILIVAYPAMLANLNPTEVVRQAVERLMSADGRAEPRDLMDDLLHMMACKAAIKAGDRLSLEEVETLLENRHLCRDAHHCPHGRPTALVFTREELDKRFKRI